MSSVSTPSTFEELLKQLSVLQAKLLEAHQREIAQLQQAGPSPEALRQQEAIATPPRDTQVETISAENEDDYKFGKSPAVMKVLSVCEEEDSEARNVKAEVVLPGAVESPKGAPSGTSPLRRQGSSLLKDKATKVVEKALLNRVSFESDPGQPLQGKSPSLSSGLGAGLMSILPLRGPGDSTVTRLTVSEGTGALSTHPQVPSRGASLAPMTPSKRGSGVMSNHLTSRVAELATELMAKMKNADKQDTFKVRQEWDLDDYELIAIKSKTLHATSRVWEEAADGGAMTRRATLQPRIETGPSPTKRWQAMHPQSRQRFFWDILAVFVLGYELVVTPMQVFPLPDSDAFTALDWICVTYWTLDIFFSFGTGVFVNGEIRLDFKSVALQYARTWMVFDMSMLGAEWATIFAAGSLSLSSTLRSGRIVRLVRFLRLLRVIKLWRVLGDIIQRINNSYILLCITFAKLILGIAMMAHVLACVWYWAGDDLDGWVYAASLDDGNLMEKYIQSFQWSLARLHPTAMQSNMNLKTLPERLLAIAATFNAMVISSLFISSITTVMADLARLSQERNHKMAATRAYIAAHNLTPELAVRLKKYIEKESDNQAKRTCGTDLLKFLPPGLNQEVRLEAYSPIIAHHSFFDTIGHLHKRTECDLCSRALDEVPCLAGEVYFNTGDACNGMLFVASGEFVYELHKSPAFIMGSQATGQQNMQKKNTADFVAQQKKIGSANSIQARDGDQEKVRPFQWISEAVLWTKWEHKGEFRARRDSTLISINQQAFSSVIKDHEGALADVVMYAKVYVQDLNSKDPDMRSDLPPSNEEEEMGERYQQAKVRFQKKRSMEIVDF